MHKNNIPIKVALGYSAIAIIMILAISLVYSNTKSIIAVNEASRDYIQKRSAADSIISSLLKEEQKNLKQLSDAMAGKPNKNYLHDKVRSLNTGKDSILVHSKAPQTHEAKKTTVEVLKTRKGFFRRLADAFKKEHAETLSVKQDSNRAVIDSVTTPVNVAGNVANILEQIDKKEKVETQDHKQHINREMEELKMVSAKLALRSAKHLSDVHQREKDAMQESISKAMEARKHLLWQMELLAIVAFLAIVVMIWLIWRDAKKERIYQENLEAANEEIQRIMNQRERLLLTITHDIKAPAASISGFIDLMKDYVSNPQGIECLQNIKNSAAHLSHLVASLLDYHQLENGLMKVQPTCFSPAQLVAESVEGMRLRAEEKGLSISFECKIKGMGTSDSSDSPMKKEFFRADAFRIRQILDNLVSNAIKYTDQGSVTIQAQVSKVVGKPMLTLSVKDTGKGMTNEEKQKVFHAFTRLKSAQGIEGTGLGLSITQELVSLLGGEIILHSTQGKGSTFIVTIPVEPVPKEETQKNQTGVGDDKALDSNPEEKENDSASPQVSVEKKKKPEFANHKILILDDDKLQLQLLQEMLRRIVGNTWQVFACNHVMDALTTLHNEQPALMLMDIEMPEMNGMDMITHINHTQMTVVAMTAHDTSILEQLQKAGFDDCLFKPFSMEKLSDILGIESQPQLDAQPETPSQPDSSLQPVLSSQQKSNPQLDSLLAFAGGDEEAAKEILDTVKQELAAHLENLKEAVEEESLSTDRIGKAAHKLLPIATMMQMGCLEELKALSPEHIGEIEEAEIREKLKVVIMTLSAAVSDLYAS
jgi:signal transduction histidine kinase/response regulator of citrate/malate metabolism